MERIDAVAALSALAQDTRLDIFRLLVRAGRDGRAVGHIAERLGLPSATLSFHLGQLKHAGLITFRREGRSLIYAANFAAMDGLIAYLMENCCAGDAGDCAVGTADSDPTGKARIKKRTAGHRPRAALRRARLDELPFKLGKAS